MSPAKYIAQKILQNSNHENIYLVEQNIKENNVFKLTDYKEAYNKADIVAFLMAHNEFKKLELNRKPPDKVGLDFCGVANDA